MVDFKEAGLVPTSNIPGNKQHKLLPIGKTVKI